MLVVVNAAVNTNGLPTHIGVVAVASTTGRGFTVTVKAAVFGQPLLTVITALYVSALAPPGMVSTIGLAPKAVDPVSGGVVGSAGIYQIGTRYATTNT